MTFERSTNYDLIGALIRNSKLWPFISDDFSPEMQDFEPDQNQDLWYVLAKDGDALLGLFALIPRSAIVYEFHSVMPLNPQALIAIRELLGPNGWLWNHTPCLRAITSVPEHNPIARRFGRRAGLEQFGFNPHSYLKNGTLQGQYLLGISKPTNGPNTPCP
jgi:hypothetical protein